VHDTDDADHAAHLVKRTALAEGIAAKPTRPVLHGDNGSTLKATTVLAILHWLQDKPKSPSPPDEQPFQTGRRSKFTRLCGRSLT